MEAKWRAVFNKHVGRWIQHGRVAVFAGGRLDRPRLGERGGYSGKKLQGRRDAMCTHCAMYVDVTRGSPTHVPDRLDSAGYGRRLSAPIP